MPTATLPTATLDYREEGPADGTTVVLVHGFLVDETLWADLPQRLAAEGFRVLAPTWPLGAHRRALPPGTALGPREVARMVLAFLETLDLREVVLVGNDTGGAICQLAIDEDASRVARLVLTNCDAFETFPPFPFSVLFRLGRRERGLHAALRLMRSARLRNGPAGFGWLVRRRLTAAESERWVTPYLTDARVRRDTTAFLRGLDPRELVAVGERLGRFEKPVLVCWGAADRFFRISLGRRLAEAFPDARLVEYAGLRTFVSLDDPARLAGDIAEFARG